MSKILVIDDESWLREMIRLALEQQGFEVIEAMDSAEGVTQAREQLPDLILCDVNMDRGRNCARTPAPPPSRSS
jgi:CheY-like chemotaxis protein